MFEEVVVAAGDGVVPDDPFDDLAGLAGLADLDDPDDLAELGELGDEADRVPDWLADPPPSYGNCAPSGWLALELDTGTAEPGWLSDAEVIEAIVGFDRIGSWAAARQARLLAELARRRPADTAPSTARWACEASEYAPDEVGVALRLARGTAAGRIELACRLLAVHPGTHALWESGRIDTAKARAVHDATWVLPDRLAAAVEARVLPRAPEQTLAQLKAALARAVLGVDPAGADTRHRAARRDRRVVVTPEAEGMASLWALLTATDAAGAYTWLTRLARGLGPDDPRTMDARRADLLAALLNGRLVTDIDTIPETGEDETGEDETGEDETGEPGTGEDETGEPGTGEEETGSQDTTDSTGYSTDSTRTGTDSTGTGTGTGTDTAGIGTGDGTGGGGRWAIHPVTPGKPLIQIVMAHSTLLGVDDQPAELVGHGPIPACLAREAAADAVWRRLVTDPLSGTVLDYVRRSPADSRTGASP